MLADKMEENKDNELLLQTRSIKKAKRRRTNDELEDDKSKIQMNFKMDQDMNPSQLYKQRLLDKLSQKQTQSNRQLQLYQGGSNEFNI